jgi:hypothetical protein
MHDGRGHELYQFGFGLIAVNVRQHKLIECFFKMFGAWSAIHTQDLMSYIL